MHCIAIAGSASGCQAQKVAAKHNSARNRPFWLAPTSFSIRNMGALGPPSTSDSSALVRLRETGACEGVVYAGHIVFCGQAAAVPFGQENAV